MDVSIIILSYNTSRLTKKCVESVFSSVETSEDFTAEVIVLDNASTDSSVKMLKFFEKNHPSAVNFKLLASKENLGFAKGNNRAVQQATSENILFLNSDIEVVDNAISLFVSWFNESHYSIAGAHLVFGDGKIQPSAGRFYSLPIAFFALFLKGDSWGASRFSPRSPMSVDWVSGACLLIKKHVFERVNGFDENIFMYWEEVDLQYKARQLSYTTGFYPYAQFIHHEGKSSNSRTYPILRVFEGYLYFYEKHYSPLQLNILRYMLKLKAITSLMIGRLIKNRYLVETYTQAYEMVKMD